MHMPGSRSTLHYKNERAMKFATFCTNLQKVITAYKEDKDHTFLEPEVVNFIFDHVNSEPLKTMIDVLKEEWNRDKAFTFNTEWKKLDKTERFKIFQARQKAENKSKKAGKSSKNGKGNKKGGKCKASTIFFHKPQGSDCHPSKDCYPVDRDK